MSSDNSQLLSDLSAILGTPKEKLNDINPELSNIIYNALKEKMLIKSENLQLTNAIDEIRASADSKVIRLQSELSNIRESDIVNADKELKFKASIDKLRDENIQLTENSSQTSSEVSELKKAIESNRDYTDKLNNTIEEKSEMYRTLMKDYVDYVQDSERNKVKQIEMETKLDQLTTDVSSGNSEISRKTNELKLANEHKIWLEKELQSRTNEIISHKENDGDELLRIAHEIENIKDENKLLKSNNSILMEKNQELSNTVQIKLQDIKILSSTLNTKKSEFSHEINVNERMKKLLEEQVISLKEEVKSNLEEGYSIDGNFERDRLINDLAQNRNELKGTHEKCNSLRAIIDEFLIENDTNDITTENNSLSSLDTQNHNVYHSKNSLRKLKRQLINERLQKDILQKQVREFVIELEHKIPMVASFKERTQALESQLYGTTQLLDKISKEKNEATSLLSGIRNKQDNRKYIIKELRVQRSDLAHQVQFLLSLISSQENSSNGLTSDEINFIKKIIMNENLSDYNDSQKVISDRLVKFRNINELQEKNIELLKTTRILANQLELFENNKNAVNMKSVDDNTINEAKNVIVDLQQYVNELESKNEQLKNQKNTYMLLCSKANEIKNEKPSDENDSVEEKAVKKINALQEKIHDIKSEMSNRVNELNAIILKKDESKNKLGFQVEELSSKNDYLQEKLKLMENDSKVISSYNIDLNSRLENSQSTLTNYENVRDEILNKMTILSAELEKLRVNYSNIQNENLRLKSDNQRVQKDLHEITQERSKLELNLSLSEDKFRTLTEDLNGFNRSTEEQLLLSNNENNNIKVELNSWKAKTLTIEKDRNREVEWYRSQVKDLEETNVSSSAKAEEKDKQIKNLNTTIRELDEQLSNIKKTQYKFVSTSISPELSPEESVSRLELGKIKTTLSENKSELEVYKKIVNDNEEEAKSMIIDFESKTRQLYSKIDDLSIKNRELETSASYMKDQQVYLRKELETERTTFEEEKSVLNEKLASFNNEDSNLEKQRVNFNSQIQELQQALEQEKLNFTELTTQHDKFIETTSKNNISTTPQSMKSVNDSKATIPETGINIASLISKETALEESLSKVNQQVETLKNENHLLLDALENKTGNGEGEINSALLNLKYDKDNLEKKISTLQRELALSKQIILINEKSRNEKETNPKSMENQNFANEHSKFLDRISEFNIVQQSNEILKQHSADLNEKNTKFQDELVELTNQIEPLKYEISNLQSSVIEKQQQANLFKEEADRWKEQSKQLLQIPQLDPEDKDKLIVEINSLKAHINKKEIENEEMNDKFNRLKKQAHERLDSTKAMTSQLTGEIDKLKEQNEHLEGISKEKVQKADVLEIKLKEMEEKFININNGIVSNVTNSIEKNDTNSSETTINELRSEINFLKEKLDVLSKVENNDMIIDYISKLDEMKDSFEKEKISISNRIKREISEKYEQESKQATNDTLENTEKLSELKKTWKEEWEKENEHKIEEAKDDLKRHLRLPSEEKINKVIDKRRQILENDFNRNVDEKANLLALSNKLDLPTEVIREELKKEIESKLKDEFNELKKKSFEEGKQQGLMRTKLLERKLVKFESKNDLQDKSNGLSKIPISSSLAFGSANATGFPLAEKVLKPNVNSTNEVRSFDFKSASPNPFTSPPTDKLISSAPNFATMNPTFSFNKPTGNSNQLSFGSLSKPFQTLDSSSTKNYNLPSFSTFGNKRKPQNDTSSAINTYDNSTDGTNKEERDTKKPKTE